MENRKPVFIVGVPRSGTTLLAAMLAAHSRISCGPETHFFRKLALIDAERLVKRDTWPKAAVDFICSIEHASFSERTPIPLIEKYQIGCEQITAFLQQREPSIPNMLSSVTEQYMVSMGKVRWAEKTPDHILTLGQIRANFPSSPIIRIIRDPRDVAISLTKVPWGAMSYLEALLLWKRMDDESENFFQSDPLCYSLRYEDLITAPEDELTKLCQFIGEEFEDCMLDTSVTGKQLNSRNVPWKDKVSQPIDAEHQSIWKDQLNRCDNQMAEAILGARLEALGYPVEEDFQRLGEICPSLSLVTKYPQAFKTLATDGVRFWKTSEDERAGVNIYLGDPVVEGWLVGNKLNHVRMGLPIFLGILKAVQSKQAVYWVAGNEPDVWTGLSAFVLKKLLSPYKFPVADPQMQSTSTPTG
jgi:hypothetical protein